MSRFSLIVFDLDGTLVDSRRDLAEAVNQVLVERGCRPLAEEAIGQMVGDGAAMLVARALDAADCPCRLDDALGRFLEAYSSRLLTFTRPYPGIPVALDALRRRADLAVLTNKPLAATRAILEGLDLARYFAPELTLGGDGPLPRKPDPSGLLHLIARTCGTPQSAVLVGDSFIDWRTAQAAGTAICIARYGFGFGSFPSPHLGPGDLVVDDAAGLATALSAFCTGRRLAL
jgi:phosphoglycolate phosphatase